MAHQRDVKNGDLRSRPPPPEFRGRWLSNFNSGQCGQWVRHLLSRGHDCDELRHVPHSQPNRFLVFGGKCRPLRAREIGACSNLDSRRRNRFSENLGCHNLRHTFGHLLQEGSAVVASDGSRSN
jgi:integrase